MIAGPLTGRASTSIDHDIAVIIMRGRQTLRTRHSHCCVVKRTSNRAGGKCSDAKPCVDTNQDKHGDSGGEQSDLAHMTLCILGECRLARFRCAGMLPPSQQLARMPFHSQHPFSCFTIRHSKCSSNLCPIDLLPLRHRSRVAETTDGSVREFLLDFDAKDLLRTEGLGRA
jgi:hypothetical protein